MNRIFLPAFLLISTGSSTASLTEEENLLITKLIGPLSNYNTQALPRIKKDSAVKVEFGFTLQSIEEVDLEKQTLSALVWLNMQWSDHRLMWNESEYDGIQDIRLRPDQIWVPDIELYNAQEVAFASRSNQVVVTSSGSLTWIPPYRLTASCKLDRVWFPFDDQSCQLKFGSWTRNGFELDIQLQTDEADTSTYVRNDEFELIKVPAKRNEVIYECCPEPYLDITFDVKLKRISSLHVSKLLGSMAGYLLAVSTLVLSSGHSQTPKILVLIVAMSITGGYTRVTPEGTFLMKCLSEHAGMMLFILLNTMLNISICSGPLDSLNPLARRCLRSLLFCRQNKDITDDEAMKTVTRWVDWISFSIHLVIFLMVIIAQWAMIPLF